MRVLVLTRLFPSSKAPTLGMFVQRRTAALAKLCEVKVLAPRTEADMPERELAEGLDVLRPRWRRIPKVGVLLDGCRCATVAERALRRMCPAFQFDVIDAHWVYPDGFAAVRLGRRLGKPVVVSGRGTDVNRYCTRWPLRVLARQALQGATRLVAVSRPLRDTMVGAGALADRVTVIHNGVDPTRFHRGDGAAARRELGLQADKRVLLSVGSLVEAKGFQHLLHGLAKSSSAGQVHLYIVGSGPHAGRLRGLAVREGLGDRVTFLGLLPQDELPRWYQAADFFCFGSYREGCPNVILEALACGTPVVSTDVGAVPDLVEQGRDGVLFAPGSAQAFARALEEALSREWDRDAIAEAGSRRSWDHVAREYYAVFEEALGRGRGQS